MSEVQKPVVNVKQGALRGAAMKTLTGLTYYGFLGIPYAKPPVGELRFRDPIPYGNWSGVRDATEEGGRAAQFDLGTLEFSGGDDCLYLNVFTPQLRQSGKKLLPVIAQIHGGGFVSGSGETANFGPVFLIEKEVLVVSMNYRLGVMGFLCTDPENARGDMGLKDQALSLKWIADNIEAFGGDPKNVTIMGVSAGAASVEYHLLSHMSVGLFHRAIMMSGSVLNPWAINKCPIHLARKLAVSLGYKSKEDAHLFKFINQFDTETIVNAAKYLIDNDFLKEGYYCPFVPVVNHFKGCDNFLRGDPFELYKKGNFVKVPTMTGVCDKEGIFFEKFYSTDEATRDLNAEKYLDYLPRFLNRDFKGGNERLKEVYTKILKDGDPENNKIDFSTDVAINGGVWKAIDLRLKYKRDEYFYSFSYDGGLNYFKKTRLPTTIKGACHADDCGYLVTRANLPLNGEPKDEKLRQTMVKMWTDFAKYGNPTPELKLWQTVQKDNFRYLDIGNEIIMRNDIVPERYNLWIEIYDI